MTRSKIAIVYSSAFGKNAPETNAMTAEEKEVVELVLCRLTTEHEAVVFTVDNHNSPEAIPTILDSFDAILFVCPRVWSTEQSAGAADAFVLALGRTAISEDINSIMILGDKYFFGREGEWKHWALFHQVALRGEELQDSPELWQSLREFARPAATVAAFKRLARANRSRAVATVASPVTFG